MAVIEKRIKLRGSKGEAEVLAIFESGSTYSCIKPELAKGLGMIEPLPEMQSIERPKRAHPIDLGTAKEGEALRAENRVSLDFYIDGYRFSDEFMLIPGLSEETIIGAKTLQAWRLKLDFEHDKVIIDPRVTKLRLL